MAVFLVWQNGIHRFAPQEYTALSTVGRCQKDKTRLGLLRVGDTGTELSADSSRNKRQSPDCAAESGANSAEFALADAQFASIVAAWPTLVEATRRAILDLVRRVSVD